MSEITPQEFAISLPADGMSLHAIERAVIIEVLDAHGWVQKTAADYLRISPRVMNYKIKQHAIVIPKRTTAPPPRIEVRALVPRPVTTYIAPQAPAVLSEETRSRIVRLAIVEGMTHAEVATEAGVTLAQVARVMRGR